MKDFIRIGRLEVWLPIGPKTFGPYSGICGCKFFDLYFIGFTWLSKECKDAVYKD
jgi:hypothetical protein